MKRKREENRKDKKTKENANIVWVDSVEGIIVCLPEHQGDFGIPEMRFET